MHINQKLSYIRFGLLMFGIFVVFIFVRSHHFHVLKHASLSDLIYFVTGLLIFWYSAETMALVEMTRVKEQPFLEIELPKSGGMVKIHNFGLSPAYALHINSIKIGSHTFDFDPLFHSRLPIQPHEVRDIWVHHLDNSSESGSTVNSIEKLFVLLSDPDNKDEIRIVLNYLDKDGFQLKRILFVRIANGYVGMEKYIYISTK